MEERERKKGGKIDVDIGSICKRNHLGAYSATLVMPFLPIHLPRSPFTAILFQLRFPSPITLRKPPFKIPHIRLHCSKLSYQCLKLTLALSWNPLSSTKCESIVSLLISNLIGTLASAKSRVE